MDPGFDPAGTDLAELARIQRDTVRNLAARFTAQGYQISPEQVDLMVRTIMGEAANEPAAGQHAVGNTMLNRMATDERFDKLAGQYDANGIRHARTGGESGTPANDGFKNTRPGSMDYNEGLEALMRPASPHSRFTRLMPDAIKTAKQYYNPKEASPSWGGPNFVPLGNHVFGNEFTNTSKKLLALRGNSPIFGDAGNISINTAAYDDDDNTLNPFDYAPPHQVPPEPTQSAGWDESYLQGANTNPDFATAALTGKEGNEPGSWGDVFDKLGGFGEGFSSASRTPEAAPRAPASFVSPGEIYRPKPSTGPRQRRYRPRSNRFASIMDGVGASNS